MEELLRLAWWVFFSELHSISHYNYRYLYELSQNHTPPKNLQRDVLLHLCDEMKLDKGAFQVEHL